MTRSTKFLIFRLVVLLLLVGGWYFFAGPVSEYIGKIIVPEVLKGNVPK